MSKRKKLSSGKADSSGNPDGKITRIVAVFDPQFREDLIWWARTKPATFNRILTLVEATLDDPFSGIGKPEPLKYLEGNVWSRRVTQEHRLVYKVSENRIYFLQARFHY